MAELSLDDHDRDSFAGHLDRVGVAELVRREPASYPGLSGEAAQLSAGSGRRPCVAAGRSGQDANNGPTGN